MAKARRVTEAEWLTPAGRRLAIHARRIASDRKLRLFGCGYCRLHWDQLGDDRLRRAIQALERYADQAKPARGRMFAVEQLEQAQLDGLLALSTDLLACLYGASYSVANGSSEAIPLLRDRSTQNAILRDLFGNPFRPVAFDPTWRTSTVEAIAAGVYADRAFDRLPVLADALEDAGCDAADLLAHLRGPGPHVRGC